MDLNDAITVTKLNIQDHCGYLMIGWQVDSFEMYLYLKEKIWKGKFSSNRLAGFSRNLQMNESDYFNSVKRCLSQQQNNYCYELKSGFFYWKRLLKNSFIIEGFLPVDVDISDKSLQPDLLEVLLALNNQLKEKTRHLENKLKYIRTDYQKCLKDTEEFLNLKIEMEKALCDKFLILLYAQKSRVEEPIGQKCDELTTINTFKTSSN